MIEVVRANGMGMELEAREIGHPCQRRCVTRNDFFSVASRWELELDDFYPLGPRCRSALLIKVLATEPIRVTDQYVGAISGAAQRAVGHGEVVANQIKLRVAGRGKQDLVGVRDCHLASGDA